MIVRQRRTVEIAGAEGDVKRCLLRIGQVSPALLVVQQPSWLTVSAEMTRDDRETHRAARWTLVNRTAATPF